MVALVLAVFAKRLALALLVVVLGSPDALVASAFAGRATCGMKCCVDGELGCCVPDESEADAADGRDRVRDAEESMRRAQACGMAVASSSAESRGMLVEAAAIPDRVHAVPESTPDDAGSPPSDRSGSLGPRAPPRVPPDSDDPL